MKIMSINCLYEYIWVKKIMNIISLSQIVAIDSYSLFL